MTKEMMSSLSLALLIVKKLLTLLGQETFNSVRIFELFIPYRTLSAAEKFRSLTPEPDAQRVDRWDC